MDTLLIMLFRLMIILSIVILFLGLFKPEWLRFRQMQPDILIIVAAAIALFMLGFTGAGAIHNAGKKTSSEVVNRGKMLSKTVYVHNVDTGRCDPGAKPGRAGKTNNLKTSTGISFNVRTPVNYDASIAHPLLMVYAPMGRDRNETEEFTYLTLDATAAGFIVAYADHRTMAPEAMVELAEIPTLIQKKWCVDAKKVFLSGHSDGGTIAMGIAFINGTKHIPTGIAPSAAGIRGDDLQERNCPRPLPVMIMHSSRDALFPNYGKETIQWWANCNGCETGTTVEVEGGCVAYSGCRNGVKTWYCEGSGIHSDWPGKNKTLVEFFKN